MNKSKFKTGTGVVLFTAMIGILFGVGGFTAYYAESLSYFSADPQACKNCHIMWPRW